MTASAATSAVLGFAVGFAPVYSFLASVSLVVAAIPEMLPMLLFHINTMRRSS